MFIRLINNKNGLPKYSIQCLSLNWAPIAAILQCHVFLFYVQLYIKFSLLNLSHQSQDISISSLNLGVNRMSMMNSRFIKNAYLIRSNVQAIYTLVVVDPVVLQSYFIVLNYYQCKFQYEYCYLVQSILNTSEFSWIIRL